MALHRGVFLLIAVALALVQKNSVMATEGEDLLRFITTSFNRATAAPALMGIAANGEGTSRTRAEAAGSQEMSDTSHNEIVPKRGKSKLTASTNGYNITLDGPNNTLSQHWTYLRDSIPLLQHRLEYFEALSDKLRQEQKFQNDTILSEFASFFYHVLRSGRPVKGSTEGLWSRKVEKKLLKRFLKYALNSEALNYRGVLPESSERVTCENNLPLPFLSKEFYGSLLVHTEEEGYEILMEVLEMRNLTVPVEQLRDVQCLYYHSFQGIAQGQAYIFPAYDEDWDRRNALFGKPIILGSIRSMVAQVTGKSRDTPVSDFMLKLLSLLPEYKDQIEETTKPSAKKFHEVVLNLQGKLMGITKSDIFMDVDTKDILLSTGVEAILDVTGDVYDPDKTPVVFDSFSRHDWNKLQLLRLAGIQILDKYYAFFSRLVTDKITQIYRPGRGLSRTFSNAFHHVRLLPTGPLLLQGFETLDQLMAEEAPRDKETHRYRIDNFKKTLQFLRGLYSTNEVVLAGLPQQIQILTDPNLNKHLKLMLKYTPTPASSSSEGGENMFLSDDLNFAEIGVNQGQLEMRAFPFLRPENDTFVNQWQFNLGYFKGYSEAWQEPVIKAEIHVANDTVGGLKYRWKEGQMVYETTAEEKPRGEFWDIQLFPDGQSFHMMYQGKLEIFLRTQLDGSGTVPVAIKGEHHVPNFLPEDFVPAEFFVVPAGEFYK